RSPLSAQPLASNNPSSNSLPAAVRGRWCMPPPPEIRVFGESHYRQLINSDNQQFGYNGCNYSTINDA
ncbi:MAG: hypothetical protein ABI557_04820, partial [Aureliella sp.]